MKRTAVILGLGAALCAACATVSAAPTQDSKNGDWTVFVEEEGSKYCYIASRPKQQTPTGLSWSPVFYVMRGAITNGRNEPSIQKGYAYEDGSQATVSIGSNTFPLFTDGDGAWVADAATESQVVEAMRAGATMIVKGTSSRGNLTTDTYSLSGVTAGLNRINELCP